MEAMYQNRVLLIGFTGRDAEARTLSNQAVQVVISLATRSSYKSKQSGEQVARTEWHQVVAWGKLGEFAASIKKGSLIAVEGELRSREYPDKTYAEVRRRVWEIRADSILKLDRAERSRPEEGRAGVPPEPVEVAEPF
jgi:single-strand DNA-binding protein